MHLVFQAINPLKNYYLEFPISLAKLTVSQQHEIPHRQISFYLY
jgi:hypothetical protein